MYECWAKEPNQPETLKDAITYKVGLFANRVLFCFCGGPKSKRYQHALRRYNCWWSIAALNCTGWQQNSISFSSSSYKYGPLGQDQANFLEQLRVGCIGTKLYQDWEIEEWDQIWKSGVVPNCRMTERNRRALLLIRLNISWDVPACQERRGKFFQLNVRVEWWKNFFFTLVLSR